MSDLKVRRLPVVNRDKRLVGIISLGDLAMNGEAAQAGQALGGNFTAGRRAFANGALMLPGG